jgi:pre-mRNA 3'-end-processing factor FIP1
LTTEYTPIQRGGSNASLGSHVPGVLHVPPSTGTAEVQRPPDDGLDTSTLPPVPAPPSHPSIDPNEVGTIDGRSVLEVDLGSMTDKAWRRPGTDIRDYFNYGFDEISYEAYCYRRRDLGELANVLKTNVLVCLFTY